MWLVSVWTSGCHCGCSQSLWQVSWASPTTSLEGLTFQEQPTVQLASAFMTVKVTLNSAWRHPFSYNIISKDVFIIKRYRKLEFNLFLQNASYNSLKKKTHKVNMFKSICIPNKCLLLSQIYKEKFSISAVRADSEHQSIRDQGRAPHLPPSATQNRVKQDLNCRISALLRCLRKMYQLKALVGFVSKHHITSEAVPRYNFHSLKAQ